MTTTSTIPIRSRSMLVTALVGLAVFAAFAFAVALNPEHPFIQGVDDAWRRLVGSGHGPETAPLPMFFQELGQALGVVVFGLALPIALLIVRRWRSALFIWAAMIGSTAAAQLVKNLVNRPRPAEDLAHGLYGPLFTVDHGSLPSGHTVTAGFIIVAVAALIPAARRWIWWILGAFLGAGMIWQRTLINAHWLSDTVIGLIGGMAVTALLWWAFAPLLARDAGKAGWRSRAAKSAGDAA